MKYRRPERMHDAAAADPAAITGQKQVPIL